MAFGGPQCGGRCEGQGLAELVCQPGRGCPRNSCSISFYTKAAMSVIQAAIYSGSSVLVYCGANCLLAECARVVERSIRKRAVRAVRVLSSGAKTCLF